MCNVVTMKCFMCDDVSFCDDCHKFQCLDCEPMEFCQTCSKMTCKDCECMLWCVACAKSSCFECNLAGEFLCTRGLCLVPGEAGRESAPS